MIECMKLYDFKLFINFFKTGNLSSLDMALTYLGPVMQLVSFVVALVLFILHIVGLESSDALISLINYNSIVFLLGYLCTILVELFSLLYKKKKVKTVRSGIILFILFTLTWIPINIVCLFKKETKWVEIKHNRNIKINDIVKE